MKIKVPITPITKSAAELSKDNLKINLFKVIAAIALTTFGVVSIYKIISNFLTKNSNNKIENTKSNECPDKPDKLKREEMCKSIESFIKIVMLMINI